MRKRIQAAVVPAVIVAAVAGAAGYRAQDSRSRRRLDEPDDPNAVNRSSGAGQDERFNKVWAGGAGSSHWGC